MGMKLFRFIFLTIGIRKMFSFGFGFFFQSSDHPALQTVPARYVLASGRFRYSISNFVFIHLIFLFIHRLKLILVSGVLSSVELLKLIFKK
jgi:hypothetical protein